MSASTAHFFLDIWAKSSYSLLFLFFLSKSPCNASNQGPIAIHVGNSHDLFAQKFRRVRRSLLLLYFYLLKMDCPWAESIYLSVSEWINNSVVCSRGTCIPHDSFQLLWGELCTTTKMSIIVQNHSCALQCAKFIRCEKQTPTWKILASICYYQRNLQSLLVCSQKCSEVWQSENVLLWYF